MNLKRRVYVAGPFSAPTRGGVQDNVDAAIKIGELVDQIPGCSSFVPHCWSRWDEVCPSGYERWMEKCLDELMRSDAVLVVAPSPGTNREIDFAHSVGKPVFYSLEALRLWWGEAVNPNIADAQQAFDFAHSVGKPVFYSLEELRLWWGKP